MDHNKLWKILKEMGIADHLTCLLRNLYAGQEATVRTGSSLGRVWGLPSADPSLHAPEQSSHLPEWLEEMLGAPYPATLSLGFSRQENWSGLPFPSPMHESEK